jgi:arylsulfatase A-like enzyme
MHVRLLDVMPTLMELASLPEGDLAALEGVSLVPAIEGESFALPVYSEAMLYGSTKRSLVDGDYKLMFDEQAGPWRLYDLAADPGETRDLSTERAATARSLQHKLEAWRTRVGRDFESRRREAPKSPEHEAADLEALRALGYGE